MDAIKPTESIIDNNEEATSLCPGFNGDHHKVAVKLAAESTSAALLAPFALLRFATLPYACLDELKPRQTLQRLARLTYLQGQMQEHKDTVVDCLFQHVSAIDADDKKYRRKVLQLKREVFSDQTSKLNEEWLAKILGDIQNPTQQQALLAWIQAQSEFRALLPQTEQGLQEELQTGLRPQLRAVLKHTLFQHALTVASPGVANHAQREKKKKKKNYPDNYERSLLSYLIRAAAKTSPFSSFMSTTVLSIGSDANEGNTEANSSKPNIELRNLSHQCRTRLNRGLVARLQRQAWQVAPAEQAQLSVNATLQALDGQRFRALCDRDLIVVGRPWRQQNLSHFQLHPMVSGVLSQHQDRASQATWVQRFIDGGVPAAKAAPLLAQLTKRGLFQHAAVTDAYDEQPEHALLNYLQQSAAVAAHPSQAARSVQSMIEHCEALNQHEDSSQDAPPRSHHVEQIRALESQALEQLQAERSESYQNVVLEDCWSSGVKTSGGNSAQLGRQQLLAVDDLYQFLCTQVGFSPLYDRLRHRFIERFGAAGRCERVMDFMMDAGIQLTEALEYGESLKGEQVLNAPVGAAMGVTAQMQLVQQAQGAPLAALNKVCEGAAWLSARFAVGESAEHEQLRTGLSNWLHTLAGDAEPVDMTFNGDCNELQMHPRLTKRVLSWPGEPLRVPEAEQLSLAQLNLVHDPESQRLRVYDGEREVHLCYLGSTMPSPSWGVPYTLSILSQPYQLMRPETAPSSDERAEAIQYVPRKVAGRAILMRAHWWVSTAYLKATWFRHQGLQQLWDIQRSLQQETLPSVFFARQQIVSGRQGDVSSAAMDANRKPLWVDCDNPFSLHLLERLCERCEWVCFTEALPGPAEQMLRVDGAAHVSELQLEMLLRRR
ncbi:MAG: lantibiotic dehydratase family protein [Xanthomonadales bacterium]|nr:lantibiotic dehydratase family protein [Xanthomonadales bacterium]